MNKSSLRLPFDVRYAISTKVLGYFYEANDYFQGYWNHKYEAHNKFVLFSSGRSGSTLLLDLLHSDNSIFCDGEILKRQVINPMKLIQTRSQRFNTHTFGFKLLSYQLRDVQKSILDKKAFLETLLQDGYQIIHLVRQNRLRQAISITYAMEFNKWHSSGRYKPKRVPIDLNIEKFDTLMQELDKLLIFERQLLNDLPHLNIIYEEQLMPAAKHQTTIEQICEFLDIPTITPETNLKKIMPKKLSEIILNYGAFQEYVRQSPYNHFLP